MPYSASKSCKKIAHSHCLHGQFLRKFYFSLPLAVAKLRLFRVLSKKTLIKDNMKKILISAIALVVVIGVGYLLFGVYQDEMLKRTAVAAIKAKLNDPYSAQFDDVHVVNRQAKVVCGFVNAKNRFGAFVGKRDFLSMNNGGVLELKDKTNGSFIDSICHLGNGK